ncbi:hypothetical protein COT75_00895 [Candidatus Beckwithbacteria bacterium CG10_big_fil_rev_8_21_14_0_10_34_10]|uniref:ArnT-like N-terminal domain-containing protein n=1 Tax=Candidatus Beckwithbacteria bacterium CG10_big_fil_rev_8_21_14_0_10_34_10 TaxID=1974495 RepID=A0A2H0WA76_9BACT|nr:MAG: hypothetical protein COT75_00895 [Candidatus Beckwithbacteria bacterium CG10_big_fil_rev_8_21_14_0_10_34_10]
MLNKKIKVILKYLLIVILFGYFFVTLFPKTNFFYLHPDEHEYVRRSIYFDLLLKKDFQHPYWQTWEAYDQSQLEVYLYGLYFHLTGVDDISQYLESYQFNFPWKVKDWENDMRSSDNWWRKYTYQPLKQIPPEVFFRMTPILRLRKMAFIISFLTLVVFFLIGKKLKGWLFGFISVFLLFQHPLFAPSTLKVMLEPSLLFFTLLNFLVFLYFIESFKNQSGFRKKSFLALILGLTAALAASSKLTGGISFIYSLSLLLGLMVYNLLIVKKGKLGQFSLLFLLIVAGFTLFFYLLTPFIWSNPIKKTYFMISHQLDLAKRQQSYLSLADQALNGIKEKGLAVYENLFSRTGRFRTFDRISRKGKGFLLDPFLFIIGIFLVFKKTIVKFKLKQNLGKSFGLLLWAVTLFFWTTLYIHMDWDHYYLPLVPSIILCQALALEFLGKKIILIIKREIK